MHLPNYKNGSIVNLMSSIKSSFGGKSMYNPLKNFDIRSIAKKNIILINIDGLGYEYLVRYGKGSIFYRNLKKQMTSVFPSTTAAATTSFVTGVAPQQHALTGWFMYIKEIGAVITTLLFTPRGGAPDSLLGNGIKYHDIFSGKSFFEDLKATSFLITRKDYAYSEYSKAISKGAKTLPFSTLDGFFRQINRALRQNGKRKFIQVYWDKFDTICHKKGSDSKKALEHFNLLNKKISSFAKSLKVKDTVIMITSDHGQVHTREKNKIINLTNHPKFVETLAMPLCAEPRAAFCYVRPDKTKQFESYVKNKFGKCCDMHKSEELIRRNYFGLGKPSPKLKDRVGDYILIMKENYIMKDFVLGEKRKINIGNHGGLSKEEMIVPLIVI